MFMFFSKQLDNADEQAAQVRRELDGQLQAVEELSRVCDKDYNFYQNRLMLINRTIDFYHFYCL